MQAILISHLKARGFEIAGRPWQRAAIIVAALALAACGTPQPARLAATVELPRSAPATAGQRTDSGLEGEAAAHISAGEAALKTGDLRGAESEFRSAISVEPDAARAYVGLGNVLVKQERHPEAQEAYELALRLDPNRPEALTNLAVVYYQLEQLPRAAELLEAALKIEPDQATTLYLLGAVRLQQGDLAAAEEFFRNAQQADSSLPEVYYGLGVLFRLRGDKASAIESFEKFLAIGPGQDSAAVAHAQAELAALRGE